MKKYKFEFTGRLIGAIGITYLCTKEVYADSIEQAKLKLYDTHEHISNIVLQN